MFSTIASQDLSLQVNIFTFKFYHVLERVGRLPSSCSHTPCNNGSCLMGLLDALWDTEGENSDQYGKSRTGRCTPGHISAVLNSCNVQAPSSSNNGDGNGSQLESFADVQPPAGLSSPLNARSTYPEGYKRQRSPAVGSANSSSGKNRIRRRPPEVRLTAVPVSHTL